MDKVYFAARWDKGTADYINCPFTKEEYDRFLDALISAEEVQAKEWEKLPATSKAVSPSKKPRAAAATPFALVP